MSTPVVDPRNKKRLAALGIRVAARQAAALPPGWTTGKPRFFLVSDYGTVAGIYRYGDGTVRVVPTMFHKITQLYEEQFAYNLHRNLPPKWTVAQATDVFERLALRFEEMGSPRTYFGSAWAMQCVLLDSTVLAPRNFNLVMQAVHHLNEAGVPAHLFYETLTAISGHNIFERAIKASVFRLANPDAHASLVLEMF